MSARRTKADPSATRLAVLGYLIREADLDGLATVGTEETAGVVGVHRTIVGEHIHALAADGLLEVIPGGAGFTSMNAIQLDESAEAYYAEMAAS